MTLINYSCNLADTTPLTTLNVKDDTAVFAASQVTLGAGSTATASNVHPHAGACGYKFSGASGQNAVARIPFAASSLSGASEFYYWYNGVPPVAGSENIFNYRHAAGFIAKWVLNTNGRFTFQNSAGANVWSPALDMTAGLYRLASWITVATAVTGVGQAAIYAADSGTALSDSGALSAQNFGTAAIVTADIGRINTIAQTQDVYLDDIQLDNSRTSLIGPINVTPSVSYVSDFTGLRTAGYTGTLSDMRRQNYLALLSLSASTKTNNDLELDYWRSIGKTGSIMDARHQ